MNTREKAKEELISFIKGDSRCILLTGTHQYEKHPLVMQALHETYKNAKILFRINSLSNITDRPFLGKCLKKQPKAGEPVRIGHNTYFFDSFTNRGTWGKSGNVDFAIVYPIDAVARGDIKLECIETLIANINIKKIFLISWTDGDKDYGIFDKYIDNRVVYDAEEEDLAYHKRVLEL